MNMQVTKLENDLDSKAGTMSTSTPNDFIASGTPVAKVLVQQEDRPLLLLL